MCLFYTGIGSRKTPEEVRSFMTRLSGSLSRRGFILRSGGADGADTAFEDGVVTGFRKEIYLPWKGFNGNQSELYDCYPGWMTEEASKHHPAWDNLKPSVRRLMTRNVAQVLGRSMPLKKSSFVICWTTDGKDSGGTGQAIRVARSYNVPVYNLRNDDEKAVVMSCFEKAEVKSVTG